HAHPPTAAPPPPTPPLFRSVAHEHRLVARRRVPALIEQTLPRRKPIPRALRTGVPHPHAQELETAQQIQVEQRLRVAHAAVAPRSEEHTSELQSRENLVGRL